MKKTFLQRTKQLLILALSFSVTATTAVFAQTNAKQKRKDIKEATKISRQATEVFTGIMNDVDKAIPKELLGRAEAVAIFPGVVKAAFIFGGRGGLGLISRRTPTGWSAPAFFKMAGGSFGAQIGVNKTDYIMLFMNDGALKGLLEDNFELGGEVGIAAGPFGRTAAASTNPTLDAGILTYSHSQGLFAGAALKGGTVTADNDRNQAVYGLNSKNILGSNSSKITVPAYVRNVPNMLTRYSSRKGTSDNFVSKSVLNQFQMAVQTAGEQIL